MTKLVMEQRTISSVVIIALVVLFSDEMQERKRCDKIDQQKYHKPQV